MVGGGTLDRLHDLSGKVCALCPLPSAYLLRLQLHLELAAPCPGRPRSAAAAASWGSLSPCIEPTIFTFMFNRYSQTKFTAWDPPCCVATGPTLGVHSA